MYKIMASLSSIYLFKASVFKLMNLQTLLGLLASLVAVFTVSPIVTSTKVTSTNATPSEREQHGIGNVSHPTLLKAKIIFGMNKMQELVRMPFVLSTSQFQQTQMGGERVINLPKILKQNFLFCLSSLLPLSVTNNALSQNTSDIQFNNP